MVDPAPEFCRERQKLQLVAAKTKLGALAWQIAETPQSLLDYLAPYIPDSPSRFPSRDPPKPPTTPFFGTQSDHTLRSLPCSRQLPLLSKSLRQSKLSRQSMHSTLQRGAVVQISSRAGGTAHTGSAVTIPTSNRATSSSTNAEDVAIDTGHSQNATYMPTDRRPLSNEGLISQDASKQNDMQQPSRSAFMGLPSRLDTAVPSLKTSKLNNGKQVCQSGAPSDLPGTSDESSTSIAVPFGNVPAAITNVGFDATCSQSGAAAKTECVTAAVSPQKSSGTRPGTSPGKNQDASLQLTASSADSNASSSANVDMPNNNMYSRV